MVAVHLNGAVVEVSYGTPELHSKFGVDFNAIYEIHQSSMNLKT
jgi:hypothetical protein